MENTLGQQIEKSVLEVIRKNSRAQGIFSRSWVFRSRKTTFLGRFINKGSFIDLAKNCGGRINLRDIIRNKE